MKLISIKLLTKDSELFDVFNTEHSFLMSEHHLDPELTPVFSVKHDNELFDLSLNQWNKLEPLPFKESTSIFKQVLNRVKASSTAIKVPNPVEKLEQFVNHANSQKRRIVRAKFNTIKRMKRMKRSK